MIPLTVDAKTMLTYKTEKVGLLVLVKADLTKNASFLNWFSPSVDEVFVEIVNERSRFSQFILFFFI